MISTKTGMIRPSVAEGTSEIAAQAKTAKRTNLVGALRKLNARYTLRDREDLASFVNWQGNASAPIHRWLRYREAYSPHLISKLSLGNKILDPF